MRIGVDLGGSKIEFIALSDDGRTLSRWRIPTPTGSYPATLSAIRDGVSRIEGETGSRGTVGVGIPGTISPASGLVKNANSTWLIGQPLDRDLETALERPVRLANDANCFALSEATDGAAVDASVVFGVILGTGVGGGIVIDGRPIAGRNAIAGEWGHNPLPWQGAEDLPGQACYCGRTGCIETFLSGPALSRDYEANTGQSISAEEIARRGIDGDSAASAILATFESRLARALAMVINILDPDVIVLGGGLSNIDRLYRAVPALWQNWTFSDRVETLLRPPVHGDSSGSRGAAWLWPESGKENQP